MKLIDYMRAEKISDDVMAERIGHCTIHAVKKWKYGERTPDVDRIARIEEITGGSVGLHDWTAGEPVHEQVERAAS